MRKLVPFAVGLLLAATACSNTSTPSGGSPSSTGKQGEVATPAAAATPTAAAATPAPAAAATPAATPAPAAAATPAAAAAPPAAAAAPPAAGPAAGVKPVVEIVTSKGTIVAELYADKAPASVKNFLAYVDKKFYDGTIFHRVIGPPKNFMIQGGGFTPDMVQKPTDPPIKNEADNGLKNERGTLAMARTMIVDSATSQFFINLKHNDFLDHSEKSPMGYGYAIFGKVQKGMGVVDAIAKVPTGQKGRMGDVPLEPVLITSIRVKK
jgi:cyclophilin family peptidyl-prolyl cis-trans isomerase